jgi:hypothetical protein
MGKIPTAKQLFDKMIEENDECTSTEMMDEFARLMVNEKIGLLEKLVKENPNDMDLGKIIRKMVINKEI